MDHKVIGNNELDGLKTVDIGKSAAKLPSGKKVRRLLCTPKQGEMGSIRKDDDIAWSLPKDRAVGGIFYVYVYLDIRKPGYFQYGDRVFDFEPFYVGKGKGCRYRMHMGKTPSDHRNHRVHLVKKIYQVTGQIPKVVRISNLQESEAFDLEKKLIKVIGRRDLGLGPLVNFTDGGEGASGCIRSEETKKRISDSHADFSGEKHPSYGLKRSSETRERIGATSQGRVHSPDTRKKISATLKGRTFSEEHRRKIGLSKVGNKNWVGRHHSEETKAKMSKAQIRSTVTS